jgi:general secretion pathway protein A
MYEQYWGLSRRPFENDARPEYYFPSDTHQAALLKLRYVVESKLGGGMLVGGFGCGKSYLAHMLAHQLPEHAGPVVHIGYPQMSAAELLAYLAAELGDDADADADRVPTLDRTVRSIERQLKSLSNRRRHPVVIVDEAHLIEDPHVFRALHLLLNFQQHPDVNCSLLLLGERSLLARVQRVEALDERLAVKAVLRPFNADETSHYVQHRLNVAGRTDSIFDPSACEALFELSGGVPRKINRLCDLGLLVGYADQLRRLSAQEIEAVAEELTVAIAD